MKYTLTDDTIKVGNRTLYRIKALIDLPLVGVKAGYLGGYIEKVENLSQEGNAWVYRAAKVFGNARVYGNAIVFGNAKVYGDAEVYGNARVYGDARVSRGRYGTLVPSIIISPYSVNPQYPNHIQVGCRLFGIPKTKKSAIEIMRVHRIDAKYHEQMWIACQLCKRWLKDNPEKINSSAEARGRDV